MLSVLSNEDKKEAQKDAERLVAKIILRFQSKLKTKNPKEREFATMIMLLSIFNPYMHDERLGLVEILPEDTEELQTTLVEMMQYPQRFMSSKSFWKRITKEAASDYIRLAILDYIRKHKDVIEQWNSIYKLKPGDVMYMSKDDEELFRTRSEEMHDYMNTRIKYVVGMGESATKRQIAGKAAVSFATIGVATLITGLIIAGTIAGSVATCGAVAAAVVGVAAIAYLWYRYKGHKQLKALDKLVKKQMEVKNEGKHRKKLTLEEALEKAAMANSMVEGNKKKPLPKKADTDMDVEDAFEAMKPMVAGLIS